MPTFQFFRNGSKCDEMRGADRKGLEERIQKFYVEVELPEEEKPKPAVSEAAVEDGGADGLRQRKPRVTAVTSEEHWETMLSQNRGANHAVRSNAFSLKLQVHASPGRWGLVYVGVSSSPQWVGGGDAAPPRFFVSLLDSLDLHTCLTDMLCVLSIRMPMRFADIAVRRVCGDVVQGERGDVAGL